MNQTSVLPPEMQKKFADLAAYLGRASALAKEISKHTGISIPVPSLEKPQDIPQDEAWFWSDEWLTKEQEANEDIATGRMHGPFESVDAFLADLHA